MTKPLPPKDNNKTRLRELNTRLHQGKKNNLYYEARILKLENELHKVADWFEKQEAAARGKARLETAAVLEKWWLEIRGVLYERDEP